MPCKIQQLHVANYSSASLAPANADKPLKHPTIRGEQHPRRHDASGTAAEPTQPAAPLSRIVLSAAILIEGRQSTVRQDGAVFQLTNLHHR